MPVCVYVKAFVRVCVCFSLQAIVQGVAPVQHVVGWTAFVPFAFLSDDGNQAEVHTHTHSQTHMLS